MREHIDDIDKANEVAQRANDEAVARARERAKPEQVQNPDGSWPTTDCDECGLAIEPGRIKLGKIRCISCQELLERVNNTQRRR